MQLLEVLDGGALTTVQDAGRYGYQRYGVPVSGAMDQFAFRVANLLAGNPDGDAALEITLVAPHLRFLADTVVALTGGDFGPRLDGVLLPAWQAVPVPAGSELTFTGLRGGARAYLAVAGGLDVPLVLGSRSTFLRSKLGGFEGRTLRAGDILETPGPEPDTVSARRISPRRIPLHSHSHTVRAVLGPQRDRFTKSGLTTFQTAAYVVGEQSDRMGYRLIGPPIEHARGADIISDGTPPGAVQVTGDKTPIVLLADRGTTGGYTKIATVISADLPLLAQAVPGDRVRFEVIDVDAAHRALRVQEMLLDEIRRSPRRVFLKRRAWTEVEGVRIEAAGWYRERHGDEMDLTRSVRVSVGAESFVVQTAATGTGVVEGADGSGEPVGGSNQPAGLAEPRRAAAAAAVAAVAALHSEPATRDFPVVL